MEKIKIGDLAAELGVKPSQVSDELKRLGVFIPATSDVDASLADRIRKRFAVLASDLEKKAEKAAKEKAKTAAKKTAAKATPAENAEAAKRKPRKVKAEKTEEEAKPAEPPALQRTVAVPAPEEKAVAAGGAVLKGHLISKARRVAKVKTEEPHEAPAPEVPTPETPPVIVIPEEEPPAVSAEAAPVLTEPVVEEKAAAEEKVAAAPETAPIAEAAKVGTEPVKEEVAAKTEAPKVVVSAKQPVKTAAEQAAAKAQPKILKKTTAEIARGKHEVSTRLFKTAADTMGAHRKSKPTTKPMRRKRPDEGYPRFPEAGGDSGGHYEDQRKAGPGYALRPIQLTEGLSIKELSEKLEVKAKDVLGYLFKKGVMTTINNRLEKDIVEQICAEFGFQPEFRSYEAEVTSMEDAAEKPEDLLLRAPVVTIMGHVDHGKTSLLDAIRETRVSEQEAGGITQHIGAYHVEINNRKIVFLDTPGHEAFTMMRARGTQVTDIVILVVAADDGVKPQTIEAIHHARDAKVPIIVAINKIDKPEAQPDRVRQMLTEHGLTCEDWGGDTVMVNVSAKKRLYLNELLEMILLVADMKELRANPKRMASGAVLEAKLDRGRGPVATVLVQNGTLRVGDYLIAGAVYGRVRAMFDDRGRGLKEAPPSLPVEVLGLQSLPQAGDVFNVVEDAEKAKSVGDYRQEQIRSRQQTKTSRMTLDHLYEMLKTDEQKTLPVILKADVQGSVEVLSETLNKLSNERVKIHIVHAGAGAITEGDVLLASAADAIVIGFNVRPEKGAVEISEREGVDVRLYTVIYEISNEIEQAMNGLLEVVTREKTLGSAEVRNTFKIPKVGTIAGCHVTNGTILRNAQMRLVRDSVVVHKCRVGSLKRFKEDVNEVRSGYECGICLEKFNDIKVGDVLETFIIEKVSPFPISGSGSSKKS